MSALVAGFTGIAGINENNGNAGFRRLVNNLGGKVGKGPIAHLPAH